MDEAIDIPRISYLAWYLRSLGMRYMFLLPLAVVISVALIRAIASRREREHLNSLLLIVVPLPALVGFVSVFDGLLNGFSFSGPPQVSEYADMWSMSLVGLEAGMWLSLPGLIFAICLLTRQAVTFSGQEKR